MTGLGSASAGTVDRSIRLMLPLPPRPTGALAVVLDGKLLLLHAGAGSNKLETARSLDLLGVAASYKFSERMKVEAVTLLEQLEAWVDKQALSLDVAQNGERISQSFDSLLKVLDSLYQVSHLQYSCDEPRATGGCLLVRTRTLAHQQQFRSTASHPFSICSNLVSI